jgi:PKD repeat protein
MFNLITEPGYSGGATLYSWNFGGLGTSTQQNPSFTFNTPGVHTVTLTTTIDDWNGAMCQDTYTMQVSVGLAVNGVGTDLTCHGTEDGEIDLTGTFGAVPYTYSIGGSYQAGTNFSGLDAGTYTAQFQEVPLLS